MLTLRKSANIANGQPSCGGAMVSGDTGIIPAVGNVNSLFDKVLKSESITGITEYRLVYLSNESNSVQTIYNPTLKLLGNTSSEIALGALQKGQTGESIATEKTAPSGIVFYTQAQLDASSGGYLAFPNTSTLAPGEFCGVWIRRKTNATSGSGTIVEEMVLEVAYSE